jgi:hypothetical protein
VQKIGNIPNTFQHICNGQFRPIYKQSELFISSLLTLFKVHADASNFASSVTKEEAYKQILEHAEALFEGQRNWVGLHFPCPSLQAHPKTDIPYPRSGKNIIT